MSTIDTSVVNALNGNVGTTQSKNTAEELRENFMTLLVTQLQNQDPLNPMENSELTSQLAQINMLNGIEELNTTLESITGQIDESQALQAAALVGHGVLVPGNQVLVGNQVATAFGIELAKPADQVKVTITNGNGQVVRQFDLGALDAGVQSFVWDATLDDGSAAPDGAYTVSIKASAEGETLSHTTLHYAEVSGVTRSSGGLQLDLGAVQGSVALKDIRQIL
ncbi:flagellar hook assembly protein FlgD [Azotobacter armeniacus]